MLFTVVKPEDNKCSGPKTITGTTSGYIANSLTDEYSLGTASCPWKVEVPHGQRINVTLLDFTVKKEGRAEHEASGYRICNVYANIRVSR